MKNRMSDLRNHLFETLERLKDGDKAMDLERAKTISEVAQTIINSAKVEVDFARQMGASPSGAFFGAAPEGEQRLELATGEQVGTFTFGGATPEVNVHFAEAIAESIDNLTNAKE